MPKKVNLMKEDIIILKRMIIALKQKAQKRNFLSQQKVLKINQLKKRNINIKKGNGKNILMNKSNTIIFMIII